MSDLPRGLRVPFFLLILIPTLLFGYSTEDAITKKELWKHVEWERLMHYRRTLFFYGRSEADSPNFFIAKDGKSNLKNELLQFAKMAINPVMVDDKHPVCRFPARTKWLYGKLEISLPKNLFSSCNLYQSYLKFIETEKVHLVFSSYYLESPASAFGHTFLRMERPINQYTTDSDLLDLGINSAAMVTTSNALFYAFMGIIGGFEGRYSAIPYFYKVREYSDYESRDLWSYELNLSRNEIDRMIDHLWELGDTSFDYYYFTENCSYNMLTLLEVARFNLDLIDKLPLLYTVPSQTVQIVHSIPGLVKSIKSKPSLRKTFDYNFIKMSAIQQQTMLDAYNNRNIDLVRSNNLSPTEQLDVLDSLIEYVDFRHSKEILLQTGPVNEWKNKILLERSVLAKIANGREPILDISEAPHVGHGTRRLEVSTTSISKDLVSYNLGYRFALHSQMDPEQGEPSLATLEFGDAQLSFENKKIQLNKFDIVEVMALNPWTKYHHPLSLKGKFGVSKDNYFCNNCSVLDLGGGTGITFLHNERATAASFLSARAISNKKIKNHYQLISSLDFNTKLRIHKAFATYSNFSYNVPVYDYRPYLQFDLDAYIYVNNSVTFYFKNQLSEYVDYQITSGIFYYF